MNWTNEPATEGQLKRLMSLGHLPDHPLTQGEAFRLISEAEARSDGGPKPPASAERHQGADGPHLKVGKTVVEENGKSTEVFTLRLGDESIHLLPLRNWGQLDSYKWTARGRLPGTPAGLDITADHVKLAGETVAISDPDACSKLEKLFADWLALEKETAALARKRTQPKPVAAEAASTAAEDRSLHYQVELDKGGQVHVRCVQGKETVASIGLNVAGFNSLVTQGLLRKPGKLQVGALHDWVEVDGVLYSFEKGNNDAAKLTAVLNEKYLPTTALGAGKDVVIYTNPASSTGFDIQFPTTIGGMRETRRRPLNEETLELLQDTTKCGLLHQRIVIKLTRPSLIFKQKTADGGERYFDKNEDNLVCVTDDDGHEKIIDLSRPVNYLHLSAVELTAVFNHPSIHRHSEGVSPRPSTARKPEAVGLPSAPVDPRPAPAPAPPPPPVPSPLPQTPKPPPVVSEPPVPNLTEVQPPVRGLEELSGHVEPVAQPLATTREAPPVPVLSHRNSDPKPTPNLWMKSILEPKAIRHEWWSCLVYNSIARRYGNSREGRFGLSACWSVALSDIKDVADETFKGIFLTEKHGFGFLNHGHVVRFNQGVVSLGTPESAIEGINVSLLAVGLDSTERFVFIVSENYRNKFGVPERTVAVELTALKENGALLMSATELLASPDPVEVVWTVPAEQLNPADPQVVESLKPETAPIGI